MKNIKHEISAVHAECERLKLENRLLRNLLKKHNISIEKINNTTPEQNQSNNYHQHPKVKERIRLFRSLFKGREDVYAVRWQSKNGKSGYTPACDHEWQPDLCQKPRIKCSECTHRKLSPLTDQAIYDHLSGKKTIGLYPMLLDESCWFLTIDFDKKSWQEDAQAFLSVCRAHQIPALNERSRSGNGCHVWIFFNEKIPASVARKLGNYLLAKAIETRHHIGMDSFDRMFPNQDTLPEGGFGNLIALPLQKDPRASGNSVFVDSEFQQISDQWEYLREIKRISCTEIESIISASRLEHKSSKELPASYPKELTLLLKDGIYINKTDISSSLIDEVRRLAVFNNPKFYKAQANRLSTQGIPRIIDCSQQTSEYLIIPRGCFQDLKKLLAEKSVKVTIKNECESGQTLSLQFHGQLSFQQEEAVDNLSKTNCGILSATTGFGKTVVATSLIAKRNINTLIIVNRTQLVNQWKEKLIAFLQLDSSDVGQIGGGKSKPSGVIDIATIQTLNRNGSIKDIIHHYGQVIVDECHHISAFSFEQVLRKVKANYVYGLTATPTRKDGLHPIMTMQCGPVVYKVSAKKQAKVRPFEHILIPRFTTFKGTTDKEKSLNDLAPEMIKDEKRNNMIFNDVLNELENGSSPLILTERIEHINDLKERFKGFVKNIIVLNGHQSVKEKKEQLSKIRMLANEEQLVIATGKYIGEGFDHDRLDCLFLAFPVSWKGTLQQYVGRLHRLHENKTKVKVYDYIDHHEPALKKMYENRLKGYHSLGYEKIDPTSKKQDQLELF